MPTTDSDLGDLHYPKNERDQCMWALGYETLREALDRSLDEEVTMLKSLVDDPDSCCAFRSLRAERMRTLQQIQALVETYRTWEW